NGYHRHVTFNDGSMARLMNFVRDVATKPDFQFVDADRREACTRAFDRGVECILKSQIRANGALTVWCAQHDEITLEPRPARTFELVSLSGAESVGILELLMSIEKPSPNVVAAVDAGVAWFEAVQIKGFRETKVNGDKRLVPDPDAPPLWARFYEIGTNRPIFSGRDGVKRYAYSEIEAERRNGYALYGTWARNLPKKHEQWKKRITP
ncbi:MAG: pectate lyase, partial [Limisphaerales bacterium]